MPQQARRYIPRPPPSSQTPPRDNDVESCNREKPVTAIDNAHRTLPSQAVLVPSGTSCEKEPVFSSPEEFLAVGDDSQPDQWYESEIEDPIDGWDVGNDTDSAYRSNIESDELLQVFGGQRDAHARRQRRRLWDRFQSKVLDLPIEKTDAEILGDVHSALLAVWADHGYERAVNAHWVETASESSSDDVTPVPPRLVLPADIIPRIWRLAKQRVFYQLRKDIAAEWTRQNDQGLVPRDSGTYRRQSRFIVQALRMLYPFLPREAQVECMWNLLFNPTDFVWVAATSAGKSLIFQSWPLIRGLNLVLIIPLNQIGLEQEERIRALGGTPLLFTSDTKAGLKSTQWDQLRSGQYTHILLSPEMAAQTWFRKLQAEPQFRKRLGLVAIDEFHLIYQWGGEDGGFRKEYERLHTLRPILHRDVRMYGCTATLDAIAFKACVDGAGFREPCVLRHSIDRPEIFLRASVIPDKMQGDWSALFYIVQNAVSPSGEAQPEKIPKTVVFHDSRSGCQAAACALRSFLQRKWPALYDDQAVYAMVRVYHGRTARRTQAKLIREFQKEDSRVRVIFATEALGLGVDIPDIKEIVQFRLPRMCTLRHIMQRAGRAVRQATQYGPGRFTLLYEAWAALPREPIPSYSRSQIPPARLQDLSEVPASQTPTVVSKKRKTDKDRCQDIEPRLYAWINGQGCRREAILAAFEERKLQPYRSSCYDLCQPECRLEADEIREAAQLPLSNNARPTRLEVLVRNSLYQWEPIAAKRFFAKSVFIGLQNSLVPRAVLDSLARIWGANERPRCDTFTLRDVMRRLEFEIAPQALPLLKAQLQDAIQKSVKVVEAEARNAEIDKLNRDAARQLNQSLAVAEKEGKAAYSAAQAQRTSEATVQLVGSPDQLGRVAWDSTRPDTPVEELDIQEEGSTPSPSPSVRRKGKGTKKTSISGVLAERSANVQPPKRKRTTSASSQQSRFSSPPVDIPRVLERTSFSKRKRDVNWKLRRFQ